MSTLMIKRNIKEMPARFVTNFSYTGDSVLEVENGYPQISFLTSGELTPKESIYVDVFLVGGGGRGDTVAESSRGGNGGEAFTKKGILLEAGTAYQIVIGAGSTAQSSSTDSGAGVAKPTYGGSTVAFHHLAHGGRSGNVGDVEGEIYGSGGGGKGVGEEGYGGNGGFDGSDGGSGFDSVNNVETKAKKGQGKTTRAFGDPNGKLYAGGGGGSGVFEIGLAGQGGGGGAIDHGTYYTFSPDGQPNTGGGGMGASYVNGGLCGSGGSGVVIIRKAAV